jgi:2-polyprenyl-6-methoxyphenol hydroxylase-like FAD-dependent oxidoreductase
MLANQLGRRGVNALVIDRHRGPARETRALGVQARTLEIYAQLGVVERALELGQPAAGGNMWAQARWMARVPLGDAGEGVTPYPYLLVLGQDDNERILGDRLRDWGLSVQWNTELVNLEQHDGEVSATLKQADGATHKIAAQWVAGCDGARSFVRQATAITFPGAPYDHVFFVADTEARGNMVANEVNIYLWRDGFHLFFPMRGVDHWRIVGILPAPLRERKDVSFDDVVPSVRGEAGSTLAIKRCMWFSTYRIQHRSASAFRSGRCFLLGDAAHIHSPMGAQGMNTGLQDAYNLAWKLALVVGGRADATLLDSYDAERVPIARRLLDTTDRAFRLVVSDTAIAGLFRTQVLARLGAFAMSRKRVQRAAFRVISQTGIHYRGGPLSKSLERMPDAAPHAGDRFPWLKLRFAPGGPLEDSFAKLDDTRFHLIAFGQSVPDAGTTGMGELVRTHAIPSDAANDAELARVHITQPSFYFVRPDGHVGLSGTRVDIGALARYASETLRLRPRGA